jgi:hypothetical protein
MSKELKGPTNKKPSRAKPEGGARPSKPDTGSFSDGTSTAGKTTSEMAPPTRPKKK